ncbi:hypothetical protein Tco_0506025 [Tanacetum coccineum]
MDKEIYFEKKIKEVDNIVYKVGQYAQKVHMLTKPQVFYDDTHKQALSYQNSFYLKKAQRIKPTLYDGIMISKKHDAIYMVDEEETLILEEESRSKMLAKQNDPILKEKKLIFLQLIIPIFWLPLSNLKSEQLDVIQTPVKIEVPRELPKKELSLDTDRLLDHIICQDVMNIIMHVSSVPVNVLSANTCLVNDNHEIERLEKENDHLFELLLSQDIVHIFVNTLASQNDCREMQQSFINEYNENLVLKAELAKKEHMVEKKFFDKVLNNQNAPEIRESFKINEWQAKLDAKDVSIANLRKHIESLKGKNVVENDLPPNKSKVIAPEMFKLDLEPLAPKVFKNRDAHIDYIKHSREHADTIREIVKNARAFSPLDSNLDSVCKWKPTGRNFTIDGNACPLTRITSTKVVPLMETIPKLVITQNPEVKVYSRRPKVTKSVGSSSKSKIVKSRISNNSEPNQSWGSNASDVPSFSLVDFRLSKLFFGIWTPNAPSTLLGILYNRLKSVSVW